MILKGEFALSVHGTSYQECGSHSNFNVELKSHMDKKGCNNIEFQVNRQ